MSPILPKPTQAGGKPPAFAFPPPAPRAPATRPGPAGPAIATRISGGLVMAAVIAYTLAQNRRPARS